MSMNWVFAEARIGVTAFISTKDYDTPSMLSRPVAAYVDHCTRRGVVSSGSPNKWGELDAEQTSVET